MYKSLIEEKRMAVMAHAYGGASRYADTFIFFSSPRHPHTAEEVEGAIYEELEKLKTAPVTDHELQKIKNQLEAGFIRSLESASGLASEISSYEAISGWRYINTLVETYNCRNTGGHYACCKQIFYEDQQNGSNLSE